MAGVFGDLSSAQYPGDKKLRSMQKSGAAVSSVVQYKSAESLPLEGRKDVSPMS
jgi:hypothetical protein